MTAEKDDYGNMLTPGMLKFERKRRKVSQEELGYIIGVSKSYISKIESGVQRPARPVARLLEQWLVAGILAAQLLPTGAAPNCNTFVTEECIEVSIDQDDRKQGRGLAVNEREQGIAEQEKSTSEEA